VIPHANVIAPKDREPKYAVSPVATGGLTECFLPKPTRIVNMTIGMGYPQRSYKWIALYPKKEVIEDLEYISMLSPTTYLRRYKQPPGFLELIRNHALASLARPGSHRKYHSAEKQWGGQREAGTMVG
jgi:hypothetical protein